MSCLTDINPNLLTIINALLSIAISDDLSADDLNVLGNFIVALGSLLLTKAAQLSAQQTKKDTQQQLQELEEQIDRMKKRLK